MTIQNISKYSIFWFNIIIIHISFNVFNINISSIDYSFFFLNSILTLLTFPCFIYFSNTFSQRFLTLYYFFLFFSYCFRQPVSSFRHPFISPSVSRPSLSKPRHFNPLVSCSNEIFNKLVTRVPWLTATAT